jgi:two-component system, sporulation sensor kinase D
LKNLITYILLTVIPALVISFILAEQRVAETNNQYKNKAQWYANFHAMNIENFLGETIGRLEMLATSIKIQHNNLTDVEKILKETQEKDSRFSGFYWSNTKGDLLISSNPLTSAVNVGDRPYFQQVLKTGKTSISDAHIGRVTGRFIITIATPIEENGEIHGILLASLRLDKIEEKVIDLIKDEIITVTDSQKQKIIQTDSQKKSDYYIKASMEISEVPWKTTAYIIHKDQNIYMKVFLTDFIYSFIILNILFLLFLYFLLRRKMKNEKKQNDIQKLELIGNLATSTAHEIKNPLTGIKGLITLLSEESPDSKSQFYFKVIQIELDRINAIVSELLVLGKPTANRLVSCNPNKIVAEIEPIIISESNYLNVQVTIRYSQEEISISCVIDQLKQVILNLVKNALHAMKNGGQLVISIEKLFDTCVIMVEDNGDGMSKEMLKQVFTPFFTMKKDGSGLGLTVCKRIIDSYRGDIRIESEVGKGTKVEIILPLLKET